MLYLQTSNRVEPLVAELVSTLEAGRADGTRDVLTPTCIVVPNLQVETYLKFSIARRTGIAANLQCQLLWHFVSTLLPDTPHPVRLLDRPAMQGLILSVLARDEAMHDPALRPVRAYLEAAGQREDELDLRRFQLAIELARLFQEYSLTRPELMQVWQQGPRAKTETSSTAEAWQQALWGLLFGPDGERERLFNTSGVQWINVPEMGQDVAMMSEVLPSHLHIFGLSYVARAFHHVFARLGQQTDVTLYGVSLSQPQLDPEELPALLRFWGRPGRENVELLRRAGVEEAPEVAEHGTETEDSILRQLQQAIWAGKPPQAPPRETPIDGPIDDPSWRILACPSMRREVEIIANEIWDLVQADAETSQSADRLRFHDIAIIVNAQDKDAYQTHIEAVFKECHDIPVTLLDVSAAAESRFIEAVDWLLALPFGTFTRQEVLRVLTHPAFLSRLPDVDASEWLAWCEQLTIVHGADREAHAETYIQRDLFNWEQGGRRLLLGTFMGGARSGETRAFELGETAYLPQEYAQDRLGNAASFALVMRSLIADARFCQTERLSLSDWAAFLSHLLTAYLDAPDERDEVYVSRCLQIVQELEALDLDGEPVAYRIAYEFVRSALEGMESHRNDYLAGGVVVASFQPMRPIPFRVVFVAGLGEGTFPASDRDNPLDVRQAQRQVGDVSPREQDVYMLLETLVSTRERLYLSYVCRDELTGETLQPSAVISELLDFASSGTITPEVLDTRVIQHPITRYDARYFPELFAQPHAGLVNVLPAARREAQAVALRADLNRFCQEHQRPSPSLDTVSPETLQAALEPETWQNVKAYLGIVQVEDGPVATPSTVDAFPLSLGNLLQFLYCPLQAWARLRLGLREDRDTDVLSREDEPFDTPRWIAAHLLRETFFEKLACDAREGKDTPFASLYDRQAARAELDGRLPTGLFLDVERSKHLRMLEIWQANLRQAKLEFIEPPQVIRLGRAEEFAAVDTLLDPIVVEVDVPDGDRATRTVQVELHGRTEAVSPSLPGSLALVTGQKPQDRDVLRGFFDHVILSAASAASSVPFHGIVNAVETVQATAYGPISQTEATSYLRDLVQDLLSGPHPYLLPVEAVLRFSQPRNKRPLTDLVNGLRDNPRSYYSSRFGPVPTPEHYEPPSDEHAQDIINRRFGLFFNKQLRR